MKALRALKIVLKDTILTSQRAYLEEAIAELEELMKPKSCETCLHRSHLDEALTNKVTNGFCVENGFFTKRGFCCNRYEPK